MAGERHSSSLNTNRRIFLLPAATCLPVMMRSVAPILLLFVTGMETFWFPKGQLTYPKSYHIKHGLLVRSSHFHHEDDDHEISNVTCPPPPNAGSDLYDHENVRQLVPPTFSRHPTAMSPK